MGSLFPGVICLDTNRYLVRHRPAGQYQGAVTLPDFKLKTVLDC